jgi:hypothetical protein
MIHTAVLRLARCRHPKPMVAFGFGSMAREDCSNCGSYRFTRENGLGQKGKWQRPLLVADVILIARGEK